jgi:hypothetical protein
MEEVRGTMEAISQLVRQHAANGPRRNLKFKRKAMSSRKKIKSAAKSNCISSKRANDTKRKKGSNLVHGE